MNNKKRTSPPTLNTPHGSASDRTHMDWVLNSQNELKGTVGELQSDSKHVLEAIKRIEKNQEKLLIKIESSEEKVNKINTKLLVFTAIFATAITVAGFFINGQATKTFDFMEKISKTELKK